MKAPAQPRPAVRIACINKAKAELGLPLSRLTAALQKCYDEHFLPVWGYPVKLYNTRKAKRSDWQFIYFDDADAAGAEGYHDLTHRGQPVSKVFVKTSLDDNVPVSLTACHELFEMVIDPIANLWAEATSRTQYAMRCATRLKKTSSWSMESRCQISCIRRGSNRSNIRRAPNSIILVCSRNPSA